MAQNLATTYSPDVVERWSQSNLTERAVNNRYKWVGETSIKVYSVDTVAMNNYTRSGDDRYGALNDVGTTLQTMTLARDRSFTTVIDTRNNAESKDVLDPAKWLARQIREIVTPEIDVYRLAALNTAADANGKDDVVADAATTASNAYTNFLALQESLHNDLVPLAGRVAFMTAGYYNFLKGSGFVLDAESAYADRKSGKLGQVDGVDIVVPPSSYFPTNTDLILTHPSVMVSPMVLTDYHIQHNPRGISGDVVEGRVVYDAFVLSTLVDGVAVHRVA